MSVKASRAERGGVRRGRGGGERRRDGASGKTALSKSVDIYVQRRAEHGSQRLCWAAGVCQCQTRPRCEPCSGFYLGRLRFANTSGEERSLLRSFRPPALSTPSASKTYARSEATHRLSLLLLHELVRILVASFPRIWPPRHTLTAPTREPPVPRRRRSAVDFPKRVSTYRVHHTYLLKINLMTGIHGN